MSSLDLADLKRWGVLDRLQSGSVIWSRGGRETGRIGYTAYPDALRLRYKSRSGGSDDWTEVDETIPLVETGQNLGGKRKWIQCLGCGRNARVLFGGPHYRCRKCYRLVYESQYERICVKGLSQAQKVRDRLGGSMAFMDAFPPKPKGMHWKTYYRLRAKDDEAQMLIDAVLNGRQKPRG